MLSKMEYLEIARIHLNEINSGFLSSLGENFLALLYECIDASDKSTLIIIKKEKKIVGFISGTYSIRSIYLHFFYRFYKLIIILFPFIFFPSKLIKILDILFVSKKFKKKSNLPKSELLSLAVLKNYRGEKIATSLYKDLIKFFRKEKIDQFKIIAGDSLKNAHQFYRYMGAKKIGAIEVHNGYLSTVFIQKT
jgi:hypothetical protein